MIKLLEKFDNSFMVVLFKFADKKNNNYEPIFVIVNRFIAQILIITFAFAIVILKVIV